MYFTAPSDAKAENGNGGHLYPFKVRRKARKNLRGTDFHFRFGEALHSAGQPSLDLPEMLAWPWRGYDPDKTWRQYEMEEAEQNRPLFRVQVVNRDSW